MAKLEINEDIVKWFQENHDSHLKFVPRIHIGYVTRIVDGDTFEASCLIENMFCECHKYEQLKCCEKRAAKFTIRILGCNAPEIKSSDPLEKASAEHAKCLLHSRLVFQLVELEVKGYDAFGRLLCEVFHMQENISDWLLMKGLAVPYKKKQNRKSKTKRVELLSPLIEYA